MPEEKSLREIAIEAYEALWEKCHDDIEKLGYNMQRTHAFIQGAIFDDNNKYVGPTFTLLPIITPKDYDYELLRTVLPLEFQYKDTIYKVGCSMPIIDLYNDSPKVDF